MWTAVYYCRECKKEDNISTSICTYCGEDKGWAKYARKYTFKGVWYNPFTWYNFDIEEKLIHR